jgi:hypothetical protein
MAVSIGEWDWISLSKFCLVASRFHAIKSWWHNGNPLPDETNQNARPRQPAPFFISKENKNNAIAC